jgi:hypothetical protein
MIDDKDWYGTISWIEEAPAITHSGMLVLYTVVPDGTKRPEPGISEHRLTLPLPGE